MINTLKIFPSFLLNRNSSALVELCVKEAGYFFIMKTFILKFREFKNSNSIFLPKLIYYNGSYFVAYTFSESEINRRGMEVIIGQ